MSSKPSTSLKSNKPLTAKDQRQRLKAFLELHYHKYNQPAFIESDPIVVPHQFSKLQDIEIAGFWTAMLSWGQRKTIISKSFQLMQLMDDSPHDFILNHRGKDRAAFRDFVHRTFQYTDTLYFLQFLQNYYRSNESLEDAFFVDDQQDPVGKGLIRFHELFFSLPDAPSRTRKHVSTPARKSSCKRLNMFLRWMVRKDDHGVDLGLWRRIRQENLYIPLDLHVDNVARRLGLLTRKQTDWQAVCELTENLRTLDPKDPVKYDFSLFGIGILEPKLLKADIGF